MLHTSESGTLPRFAEDTSTDAEQLIHRDAQKYAHASGQAIEHRLGELDKEWDHGRMLVMAASAFALVGLVLGGWWHPAWLLLPAMGLAVLFFHAVFQWYPLQNLFHDLEIRTASEIAQEKYALKCLRGDFENVERKNNKASRNGHTRYVIEDD